MPKRRAKIIREGQYMAEVEVELLDDGTGWAPYLSAADACKLDEIRDALRRHDIAELKRQLEWAGRERHQEIIQQLSAIQEYLVGGRTTEAKSTWQSVAKKIGSISGAVNNVWELFGRVSRVLT